MLPRDVQRLALAVALTIVLLYSISLCFAGDKPRRDWITYTSDELDKVDAALHHGTTHDIPIPLPDPKVIPKDDGSGDKITLKEPPGKGSAQPAERTGSDPMAAKEQQHEAAAKDGDDASKAPNELSSSEPDLPLS